MTKAACEEKSFCPVTVGFHEWEAHPDYLMNGGLYGVYRIRCIHCRTERKEVNGEWVHPEKEKPVEINEYDFSAITVDTIKANSICVDKLPPLPIKPETPQKPWWKRLLGF